MDAGSIIAKYSTSDTIPSAARALNYFEAKSPNIWICKKDKFEPIDARKLLDFIYDKAEERRNTKNQSKDSPPFLVSYPLTNIKKSVSKIRVDFMPPTIKEVEEYCNSRRNDVNPGKWYSFYASKDWMVGSHKMKSWRHAVITWEKSNYNTVIVKGKLNEYSDNEIIKELKNRGYIGGIKKDVLL